MEKKYKILIIVLILIAGILIINEFVLFPIFPNRISTTSCALPQLSELIDKSNLIIIGFAGDSKWVTREVEISGAVLPPGEPRTKLATKKNEQIFTDSTIVIDDVIKGSYNQNKMAVMQSGGCNVRLNYCIQTSIFSEFKEGRKYLLFLSNPNEKGIYDGFSGCGGKYEIRTDSSGKEIIDCFAQDIESCTEKEVQCPGDTKEQAFGGISEDGKESKPVPCIERYVLLNELIKQIRNKS